MNDRLKSAHSLTLKEHRAAYDISNTPDGRIWLDSLSRRFGGNVIKKGVDGHVDPTATQIALGSKLVIEAIEDDIAHGKLAR